MSITSAGGTRWADEANDKLAAFLADLLEERRVTREDAVRRAAEAFARGQSRYQLADIVSLEAMCVGWIRTTPIAERANLPAFFAKHDLDFTPFEEYTAAR
ncbi:MAG: hypothetical protein M3Y58_11250 [Chloroflexota bacterium]|nr:hypothetical protein [Chloroflexota bacterium]